MARNKSKQKKKPIYVIDVETDPFLRDREPLPFLWGVYDGQPGGYRQFEDAEAMLRFLHTLGEIVVYAHNGGKFDYTYLFGYLEAYTEVLIISGRLARFKIGDIEFRDSWSILPVALKHLGKGGIDFHKLERDVRHLHMTEIIAYNRQDCVALWEAVFAFTSLYGNKLTLAGAALDYWSKHFKHEKPKSDSLFYSLIAPFYTGGRVECFHKGMINHEFSVADINSAYPYAMTHKHPFSTNFSSCTPSTREKIILQSMYRITGVSRGALPFKDDKKSLLFPCDDTVREYTITGWELQAAIDTDTIEDWSIVERKDFLKEIDFCDYVGHFYEMKKNAKKGTLEYQFAKLMQNSLYGKFGANPENYASYGLVPTVDIENVMKDPTVQLGRNMGPWDWAGNLGEMALMEGRDPATGEKNEVESEYYNVATAASITGFVRAYLWRRICAVRAAGGTVYYCDTDSIVYSIANDAGFVFSKELGDWTDEGCFSEGAIGGKKLYAFKPKGTGEWKTASKGVRISAQDIVKVAQGNEHTWLADAPQPSLRRKLKKGETKVPAKFMHRKVRMT